MDDLMLYNPVDYDDDELDDEAELELIEFDKPKKRRKRRRNPEPIAIATPLLLLVAGYLGWCAYAQSKTKVWTWTPWKKLAIGHRLPLGRPLRQNYSSFDAAVEKMMAPSPSVVEMPYVKPKFQPEEQVGFITP